MAHEVATFRVSKEFFDACITFGHEAFEKGHELGRLECWNQVTDHHQGLDLAFLDQGEFNGEPSDHDGVATPSIPIKAPLGMPTAASKAIPTKPIAIEPSVVFEPASADPVITVEPSATNNPNKEVGN